MKGPRHQCACEEEQHHSSCMPLLNGCIEISDARVPEQSKDYGKCKSLRKDGQPCGNVVNLSECIYCEVHMTKEYKKLSSKRANMNNWPSGPPQVQTVAVSGKFVLSCLCSVSALACQKAQCSSAQPQFTSTGNSCLTMAILGVKCTDHRVLHHTQRKSMLYQGNVFSYTTVPPCATSCMQEIFAAP